MTTLTLSELYIYPIKSAAGIALSEASLTARGLQYDRRWMVVDGQGKFLTQRRFPRMALIGVSIAEQLNLSAPGMPDLSVPLVADSAERIMVEVWGDRCTAIPVGNESKAWFTQFLGMECQLVYMPDDALRPTDHGKLGENKLVSFADAYPYLLISERSLIGLNHKLAAAKKPAVSMSRFRPNFVVKGAELPHIEDSWQQITIGSATFDLPKLCDRCAIPNVDPMTGDRGKEPTQTLATYRYWDKGIWFGQNCVQNQPSEEGGTLQIGDAVEVILEKSIAV